jgi:ornithine decarboxylase
VSQGVTRCACTGGGYPGTDSSHLSFHDVAATVAAAIDRYFPPGCGVDIIAEPGRYFASACHTYAVSVIAKRELNEEQLADASAIEAFGTRQDSTDDLHEEDVISSEGENNKPREAQVALYINDGVYGSFNCVVFDHAIVVPQVLVRKSGQVSTEELIPTKLFGPTCDSIDVVLSSYELPSMDIGDWLFFEEMGAYTRCAASRFNGQGSHTVHYVWRGSW